MKNFKLVLTIAEIILLAIFSLAFSKKCPSLAGMIGGFSVCLTIFLIVEKRFANVTVGTIIDKLKIIKTGIFPLIMFGISTYILCSSFILTSYVWSLLGVIFYQISSMFVLLALTARALVDRK